jgi:hypothetical protein
MQDNHIIIKTQVAYIQLDEKASIISNHHVVHWINLLVSIKLSLVNVVLLGHANDDECAINEVNAIKNWIFWSIVSISPRQLIIKFISNYLINAWSNEDGIIVLYILGLIPHEWVKKTLSCFMYKIKFKICYPNIKLHGYPNIMNPKCTIIFNWFFFWNFVDFVL